MKVYGICLHLSDLLHGEKLRVAQKNVGSLFGMSRVFLQAYIQWLRETCIEICTANFLLDRESKY